MCYEITIIVYNIVKIMLIVCNEYCLYVNKRSEYTSLGTIQNYT